MDAFERGDMERLDGLIADDVVRHEIGRSEPQRGKAFQTRAKLITAEVDQPADETAGPDCGTVTA